MKRGRGRVILAITIAIAIAAASGCGDDGDGDGATTGGGGAGTGGAGGDGGIQVTPLCPASPPDPGACEHADLSCYYYGFGECPIVARCRQDAGSGELAWGNDVPQGDCPRRGLSCAYTVAEAGCLATGTYECNDALEWEGELSCTR